MQAGLPTASITASSGWPRCGGEFAQGRIVRREGGVGPHGQGPLRAWRPPDRPTPTQPKSEQPGELDEAQPHRPGAEHQDVVAGLQLEVAEAAEHLAPRTHQHGLRGRNVGRDRPLDLVALEPAVRGVGHAVGHHRVVVVGQRVVAEAAPAAGVARVGELEHQPADRRGRRPGSCGPSRPPPATMPVLSWPRISGYLSTPGKMPGHQLAVGGVAQRRQVGLDQRLVRPGLGRPVPPVPLGQVRSRRRHAWRLLCDRVQGVECHLPDASWHWQSCHDNSIPTRWHFRPGRVRHRHLGSLQLNAPGLRTHPPAAW